MRIAIVTFCFDNFGTKLQTYALSRILSEAGMDVSVIDMEMLWNTSSRKEQLKRLFIEYSWKAPLVIAKKLRWFFQCWILNRQDNTELINNRKLKFKLFSKEFIPYTEYYSCDDIRKGVANNYDIYITGSDQVWNYELTSSLDIYFLSFVPSDKQKMSYAASFGVAEIPLDLKPSYKRLIQGISTLLVREETAREIAFSLGRDDAKVVLDPTLLLSSKQWDTLLSRTQNIGGMQPDEYILVYSLNSSVKIYTEAEQLAKREAKKLVIIKRSFCPPRLKNATELYDISPVDFMWLIKNATCVITNSFHALLYSINYNTDYYTYLEKTDTANSRLLSIQNICKVKGRTFFETEHLPLRIESIDYTLANEMLKKEREKSLNMLLGALNIQK